MNQSLSASVLLITSLVCRANTFLMAGPMATGTDRFTVYHCFHDISCILGGSQCIRLAQTYDTKHKWIREGLKCCCNPPSTPPTPTSSHQCLELLLNSTLLDVLSGQIDNAIATLDSALFSQEQQQLSSFVRLSSQLTQEDRALACLTRICLAVSNTLPHTLFESPDSSPPARIIRTCVSMCMCM